MEQKYVDHSDGLTMQYGNPNNSAQVNEQIGLIRTHYFTMQNISTENYLPPVACPRGFVAGYDADYTYL